MRTFRFIKEKMAARVIIGRECVELEQMIEQHNRQLHYQLEGVIYKAMDPPAQIVHRMSRWQAFKRLFKNPPMIITIDRSLVLAEPPQSLRDRVFMIYTNARVYDSISDIIGRKYDRTREV